MGVTLDQTDWMLEDPDRPASVHGTGPRSGAGTAFAVIVILSLGLWWFIWAGVLSLATAVLKSVE